MSAIRGAIRNIILSALKGDRRAQREAAELFRRYEFVPSTDVGEISGRALSVQEIDQLLANEQIRLRLSEEAEQATVRDIQSYTPHQRALYRELLESLVASKEK